MNIQDEVDFAIFLEQTYRILTLRRALDEATSGLWKAAELTAPGYVIPPDALHHLLIRHRDAAREALERTA